jgi:hypothetical protein
MPNGILKTNWAAVGDSVLTGVVAAVLTAFGSIVMSGNFDVFTANWVLIGHSMTNVGFIAAVTILVKDLLSTNSGSLLGIGPSQG